MKAVGSAPHAANRIKSYRNMNICWSIRGILYSGAKIIPNDFLCCFESYQTEWSKIDIFPALKSSEFIDKRSEDIRLIVEDKSILALNSGRIKKKGPLGPDGQVFGDGAGDDTRSSLSIIFIIF